MWWVRATLLTMMLASGASVVAPSIAVAQADELASARVRGQWNLTLSPSQEQRVRALEFAFQDPVPTDDALREVALDEEAMMLATLVVALRRDNPGDPQIRQYREGLEGLKSATLVVDETTMTIDFGTMTSRLAYRILDDRPDRMQVETTDVMGDHTIAALRLREDGTVMQYIEEGPNGQQLGFTRAP